MPGLHEKKKTKRLGPVAAGLLLVAVVAGLLLWRPWRAGGFMAPSPPVPSAEFIGDISPKRAAGRSVGAPPAYDARLLSLGADGRMQYGGGARLGIDVSEWQYDIDWERVAADGIEFAIIRVGYRGSTHGGLFEDAFFRQNMDGALAAGLDVGVYFYSQAVTPEEALEEAEFTLSRLTDYTVKCPVVFDWEIVGGSGARTYRAHRQTLQQAAVAFCEAVRSAGYEPMIYFTQYLGLWKYRLHGLEEYGFWFAEYSSEPHFPYDFDMWQYTSTGAVDGITEEVDINIWFSSPS